MATISRKRERDCAFNVDWSAAPADVLRLIASKSSCAEHYLSFTSTCRGWRSAATNLEFSIRLNWLMPASFSRRKARVRRKERVLCDVVTSKRHRLHLPEIAGHTCFGSKFGYLIATRDRQIFLFDPISRASVPLPLLPVRIRCLCRQFPCQCHEVLKGVLAASPADPDCFVVVQDRSRRVYFAKPNDAVWSPIYISPSSDLPLVDFMFFNGYLYCICIRCPRVAVIRLSSSSPPRLVTVLAPPPLRTSPLVRRYQHIELEHTYLVEIDSAICMLVSYEHETDENNRFAEIFKLVLHLNRPVLRWMRIDSLGESCLTIGCEGKSQFDSGMYILPNLRIPGYRRIFMFQCLREHWDDVYPEMYFYRSIYRPRTETGTWAIQQSERLIPKSKSADIYTRLYPSIRFGATISVNVLIRFLSGRRTTEKGTDDDLDC